MSTRVRLFLAILLTAGVGFSFLVHWIARDLKPQFRVSTEEPLADAAWILAGLASSQMQGHTVDVAPFRRMFEALPHPMPPAPIYDFIKTTMDLRVYVTDAIGRVLFDSAGLDEGEDYSRWNDVHLTLQGRYGTRTTTDLRLEKHSSIMYVAAPIVRGEAIVGVVSVGKPSRTVNTFIDRAQAKIVEGGLITFAAVVIVTLITSAMITRPIERLIAYTKAVSRGERTPVPRLGDGELGQLGQAFEEMRAALEGKRYIEQYIQTLTHEMKSPLAAIQGAVELLREPMPPEQHARFCENIGSESKRMQRLIERLLLLASIERTPALRQPEPMELTDLVRRAMAALTALGQTKEVRMTLAGAASASVRGDALLLETAVLNLLQNALDFAPRGSTIEVAIQTGADGAKLTVTDQGPGIPAYALERVFERFYSLNRPDTGKKSTGLGLSLVREIMALHGGEVRLENRADGGVLATLIFPG